MDAAQDNTCGDPTSVKEKVKEAKQSTSNNISRSDADPTTTSSAVISTARDVPEAAEQEGGRQELERTTCRSTAAIKPVSPTIDTTDFSEDGTAHSGSTMPSPVHVGSSNYIQTAGTSARDVKTTVSPLVGSNDTRDDSSDANPHSQGKRAFPGAPKATSPDSKMRRGKWTQEEEEYVTRVIKDFNSGVLRAPAGTTLRSYLSDKLNCDPMRITKKFTGELAIGKRVFHPVARTHTNADVIDRAQAELEELERKWRKRLEIQRQESAKKAAASAAAAASGLIVSPQALTEVQMKRKIVVKTASWLDRADAILSATTRCPTDQNDEEAKAKIGGVGDCGDAEARPPHSLQRQMEEVEGLLKEGSLIQKTGLPRLLQGTDLGKRSVPDPKFEQSSFSGEASSFDFARDPKRKRPERSVSANQLPNLVSSPSDSADADNADAEGAHVLVGLLGSTESATDHRSSPPKYIRRYSE